MFGSPNDHRFNQTLAEKLVLVPAAEKNGKSEKPEKAGAWLGNGINAGAAHGRSGEGSISENAGEFR